jgi:hypothetical protein
MFQHATAMCDLARCWQPPSRKRPIRRIHIPVCLSAFDTERGQVDHRGRPTSVSVPDHDCQHRPLV